MSSTSSLPCPVCQAKVPFDVEQLIRGARFACSNCGATIGIAADENAPKIEDRFEKLNELKKSINSKKK